MSRIEKLTGLLKDNPEDSFLQHALALEFIKEGNDHEAKVLFETILAREPGYIGSYYHLGKLLERWGNSTEAITVYEAGMRHSKDANDRHSYNELQGALDDLTT